MKKVQENREIENFSWRDNLQEICSENDYPVEFMDEQGLSIGVYHSDPEEGRSIGFFWDTNR